MGLRLHQPRADIATVVSGVLRAASLCAPAALLEAPPALAQVVESRVLATDIPAQPLAEALAAFARQTGVQLVYISDVVRDQKSHAVPAGLSARDALAGLLQGTGLRFELLTAHSVRIFPSAPPREISAKSLTGDELSEIVVTASRREENLQDVPITIQAVTADQLTALNVTNFDDLLRYTTNLTTSGNGPGTGNIFIRGLGSIGTGNQSQSTTAPFPNVALYLDEQSMEFPARNNDVYVVDMERIEVLEGPQGTLFGGGAQAGAIRYITNKPKLHITSAEFNAGYGYTAGGENNSQVNAVLNVPLGEQLAFRALVFNEHQGGYIDNVPSHIGYLPDSPQVLAGVNPIANNAALVANATNPIDYQGIRASLLWQFNPSWNVILQQNYQDIEAHGYFYAYPYDSNGVALQPYQIATFTPAYNKDRYWSTSLTVNGEFDDWKLIYAGNYMVRHIQGQQDYSNYLRSPHSSYYGCIGTGAGYFNPARFPALAGHPLQCYAPIASWNDLVENIHNSQELRLSSPNDLRLRGLLGAYWEKFVIYDDMNFSYLAIPQCDPYNLQKALAGSPNGPDCLAAVGPLPGSFANDPTLREGTNTAFGEDIQRGYKQTAFFLSLDFDLIPKTLTLGVGTRYYHYDEFENGSQYYTQSATTFIVNHPNGTCTAAGYCGIPITLSKSESGFRSRADLNWKITPGAMAYLLFSQGFRPGGFNRVYSSPTGTINQQWLAPYFGAPNQDSTYQYVKPVGYNSDTLNNYELGFKSEFFDHHLLFNLSLYYMEWNHTQLTLYDPTSLTPSGFNVNGASYTVKGIELQFAWRISKGLTLMGSSSNNITNQSDAPCLQSVGATSSPPTANNPTPAGQCITQISGLPYTNPFGQLGTRPPFSPPWMFNIRARYDWNAGGFHPFLWAGASHISSMSNEPASFPAGDVPGQNPPTTTLLRYQIPGFTTYGGALGVSKGQWTLQIQGSNLTDVYGPSNISSAPFIKAEIPLRPRVLMAQFAYRF